MNPRTVNHDIDDEDHYRLSRELAEEIAKTVEARLISRAAMFLLLNGAALIGAIGTGIGAYYSLDKRQTAFEVITDRRVSINDARIERLIAEDLACRNQVMNNYNAIMENLNETKRLIYEHDSVVRRNK